MQTQLKPGDNEQCLVDLLLDEEPIDTNTALLQIDTRINTDPIPNPSNHATHFQYSSSEEDLFYVQTVRNDTSGFLRGYFTAT